MPELRRISTRSTRAEPAPVPTPAPKKRKSTHVSSSLRSTPAGDSPTTFSAQSVEDTLPNRIDENSALPTLHPGSVIGVNTQLQSIAESGVLAASLNRSRNAWLNDGLFDRFWSKPAKKKKGEVQEVSGPPKDCMNLIGTCQFVIEPHTFDVKLFGIHEWRIHDHALLNAPARPASTMTPTHPTPSPAPSWPHQATPAKPSNPTMSTPGTSMFSSTPSFSAQADVKPPPPSSKVSTALPNGAGSPPSTQQGTEASKSQTPQPMSTQSTPQVAQPSPVVNPAQDPVIQMLAQRASMDPALKSLMKIVASGSATPGQLREFQTHIDELNAIVQRQRFGASMSNNMFNTPGGPPRFSQNPGPGMMRPSPSGGTPLFSSSKPGSATNFTTPAKTSKVSSSMATKSNIIGLAIEFVGSNGDRYHFPRHSILEFAPNAMCILASFLVVKKIPATIGKSGSGAVGTGTPAKAKDKVVKAEDAGQGAKIDEADRYKDAFHQPVTMRIIAEKATTLQEISRTVSSYEEAKRYMDDIMSRTQRADDVILAMRLPVHSSGGGDGSEVDTGSPAPSTPTDRRMSVLGTGVVEGRKTRKSKIEEYCQYCFAVVPAATAAAGHPEQVACEACAPLLQKNGLLKHARPAHYNDRKSVGPKALMLNYEIF